MVRIRPQHKPAGWMAAVLLCFFTTVSHAQFGSGGKDKQDGVTVSPMTWSDKNEFKNWVNDIGELTRRHFGQPITNTRADLNLLQRLADREIIPQTDTERLQAMGVVLGNLLEKELGLEWQVYKDDKGRSRALCVPNTKQCLFPVTMLSRRLEAGLEVDVHETYKRATNLIKPYLPDHNAYDGKKPDPEPKPSWTEDREEEGIEKPEPIPIR